VCCLVRFFRVFSLLPPSLPTPQPATHSLGSVASRDLKKMLTCADGFCVQAPPPNAPPLHATVTLLPSGRRYLASFFSRFRFGLQPLPALRLPLANFSLILSWMDTLVFIPRGCSHCAVTWIWEENEDGTGTWRMDIFTADQTGCNESEAKWCADLISQSFAVLIIHISFIQHTI
jgi:hypothetical protein